MNKISKLFCIMLFVFCCQQVILAATKFTCISGVRYSSQGKKIRIVLDASAPIRYQARLTSLQITLLLKNAKLQTSLNQPWLQKTTIKLISHQQLGQDLQLVIVLKNPVIIQHFVLAVPHRLVLDISPKPNGASNILKPELAKPTLPAAKEIALTNDDKISAAKLRDIVVVIDPGHGGKDPGAIGVAGTYEKNVVLAVAKAMQTILNHEKGFKAVLTRSSDYFIPLRGRLNIARQQHADMFIAIHADAFKYHHSSGASVFALSQRGATSEAARWLAEKENESESGQALVDQSTLLRSVLIDLEQTATISAGLEIGDNILKELTQITHLHSARVEQAAFVVLKSPDIPSLLIETGFLSDPSEEMRLKNANYQQKLADCLASGIVDYFRHRPPKNTYLAAAKV